MSAYASSWAERKWLTGFLVLTSKSRLYPSLRNEVIGAGEVVGRVSRCPAVYRYRSSARKELVGNGVAVLRHSTRETRRHRWKDAQRLVNTRIHVGKFLKIQELHVFGRCKTGSYLFRESLIRVWGAHKPHRQAREKRSCGLGTSNYEQGAVEDDLVLADSALFDLAENVI